ncbi:Cullin-domain-containing protein [Stipitochalara longipes BDJ]|nr:Cullin-domain-containing protein [Stipitochalara longipes BDJ]
MSTPRSLGDMPPRPNRKNLEKTWSYIEVCVNSVLVQSGLDVHNYMACYGVVHNYCTAQKSIGDHSFRGAHILGKDLYLRLISILDTFLLKLLAESESYADTTLLVFYVKQWEQYTTAAKHINQMFRYLNRHWVRREIKLGKKGVYQVYWLHLVRWRSTVFSKIHDQIIPIILKMIEKQRNGETIDSSQIKKACDSFVDLSKAESDPTIYSDYFKKPFLEATKTFYRAKSAQFVVENSVTEFMEMVQSCLEKEELFLKLAIPEITVPGLYICEDILIREHSVFLQSQFRGLLEGNRYLDVQLMYRLLSRIRNGLGPLYAIFEDHVKRVALSIMVRVSGDAQEVNAKSYVNNLFQIYRDYRNLVIRAFDDDPAFGRAFIRACKEAFNHNAACEYDGQKSAELLATYADILLKKAGTGQDADDRDNYLTRITTILNYIKDNDVFQAFYSKKLARRLRMRGSEFDEIETEMVNKLRGSCGISYTNSLRCMMRDMKVSKDLDSGYKDFETKHGANQNEYLKASYLVLTQNSWPLVAPSHDFIPPQEIHTSCQRFQSFYDLKYSERKLTWLWQYCSGELLTSYCTNKKGVPYRFQASIYQMAILLLFNEADINTYEEISIATHLPSGILDRSLYILIEAKVLSLKHPSNKSGNTYQPTTKFHLNYSFRSRKIRINLNVISKAERKEDADAEYKNIKAARNLLIQSTIMRIMKTRKRSKYSQLVSECVSQVRSRFILKDVDVKKSIDQLLDKEYLERLDDDELGYLP